MRTGPSAYPSRRLWGDRRGVAAVEFAILLPLLALMSLTAFEVSRLITHHRKIEMVAGSLGQLISQNNEPMTAARAAFIRDSALLVYPQLADEARRRGQNWQDVLTPTMSSVVFRRSVASCSENCAFDAYVAWSAGPASDRRPCGKLTPSQLRGETAPTELPDNVYGEGSVIVVDVRMAYQAVVEISPVKNMDVRKTSYFTPRYLNEIPFASGGDVATICTVPA